MTASETDGDAAPSIAKVMVPVGVPLPPDGMTVAVNVTV